MLETPFGGFQSSHILYQYVLGYWLLLLFSCQVMSDSLRPHGLKHARLPCPSLSLLEFAQTHVHWVSDAIQPSHPLLPPYPPALNLDSWGMKWTPVSKDAYLKIEGEESHLESLARRSWRERSNVMEAEETQSKVPWQRLEGRGQHVAFSSEVSDEFSQQITLLFPWSGA